MICDRWWKLASDTRGSLMHKQVYDLTPQDLLETPVWYFPGDEIYGALTQSSANAGRMLASLAKR